MKKIFALSIISIITATSFAQNNVGIGTNAPDASAALDISSTTTGLLIPRMTTAQRNSIATPAKGLMVFDNDSNSFWYFDGNSWNNLAAGGTLSLPYQQTINSSSSVFDISNQGSGAAIQGKSTSEYGIGITALTNGTGGWGLNAAATRSGAIAINAFSDSGTVFNGSNLSPNNSDPAMRLFNYGKGHTAMFQTINPGTTVPSVQVASNGIGNGLTVYLTNPSNGARGIEINQAGVGPAVFATSAGGNAVWGITNSISAAGIMGDNTLGTAVEGRNRGGNGVGAVVGRNDSSGYGVRGFNTENGIGVLGQSGISGGTGVGGRFENVNAANGNDALQAATNGTGWTANFTNSNNSASSKGISVATTNGQGGTAFYIANGSFANSYQRPYTSNTVVDDATLVLTATGNVTIPTAAPLTDGAHIWVVNNSGGAAGVTNTTAGALAIANGRAQEFIFVSAVSASWIPVQ